MNIDWGIVVLVTASLLNLALSFLFSLIETSLIITDDVKMRMLINKEKNEKKKKRIIKILEKRDPHGAALSVAITLTNVTGSSILGSMAAAALSSGHVIIFTLAITYLMLVFARTVPKIYARKINEKIIKKLSWLIRGVYIFSIPILAFTLIWVKILGLNGHKKKLSITELKGIIGVYRDSGIIAEHEEKIFESVFAVKNELIENFVHKEKEIFTLNADSPVNAYKDIIKKYKRKKFFVEKDGNIVGIAFHRDLLSTLLSTERKENPVSEYTKKALIVNGTEKLVDIIVKLEDRKLVQSIILDAEREPIGILSIKDIYLLLAGRKD